MQGVSVASFDVGLHNLAVYSEDRRGRRTFVDLWDLSPGEGLTTEARKLLLKKLRDHKEVWKGCDVILIEKQFSSPGFGHNVVAIRLEELIAGWFLEEYPFKVVASFPSRLKTTKFGGPTGRKKKAWAVGFAKEKALEKGDEELALLLGGSPRGILERLEGQKLDDVADAFLQLQAFRK